MFQRFVRTLIRPPREFIEKVDSVGGLTLIRLFCFFFSCSMIIIRITLQYRWRSVFVNCQSATHDPLTARFFWLSSFVWRRRSWRRRRRRMRQSASMIVADKSYPRLSGIAEMAQFESRNVSLSGLCGRGRRREIPVTRSEPGLNIAITCPYTWLYCDSLS